MSIDTSGNVLLRPLTKDPATALTAYRDQHFKVSYSNCVFNRVHDFSVRNNSAMGRFGGGRRDMFTIITNL